MGIKRNGILEYEVWSTNWSNENEKIFDNLIFYCLNKDGRRIERIYIFPYEDVIKRKSIGINKNPKRFGNIYDNWYEKNRISDENVLKQVNDLLEHIRQKMKEQ